MAYTDFVSRSDAAGGLPEPILQGIFDGVMHKSLTARAFQTIPLSAGTNRLAVTDALPFAMWQNPAETGVGQSSDFSWKNVELVPQTLMAFVPVPKSILEDSQFDVVSYLTPKLVEAMTWEIDRAVLFGGGSAPSAFGTPVWTSIVANSATYTANTAAASGGLSEDFNKAAELVVNSGYNPTSILGSNALTNKIRRARATDGQRLNDLSVDSWEGLPIYKGMGNNDLFKNASGQPLAIVLDKSQFILGIRRDVTLEVLTQSVISDNSGKIIHNAATSDMVIIKATMRVGYAVANSANRSNIGTGTNEVQTLTQSGGDGLMTISFGGYTTSDLAAEATAAEVQAALENLASIGVGNITVARTGSAGARVYTLTFVNQLGSKNQAQVTATIGTGTITPATTTAGAVGARVSAAGLIAA